MGHYNPKAPTLKVNEGYTKALVDTSFAFMTYHFDAAHLSGVCDMGTAVCLHVQSLNVDGADFLYVGREEIDLGAD